MTQTIAGLFKTPEEFIRKYELKHGSKLAMVVSVEGDGVSTKKYVVKNIEGQWVFIDEETKDLKFWEELEGVVLTAF